MLFLEIAGIIAAMFLGLAACCTVSIRFQKAQPPFVDRVLRDFLATWAMAIVTSFCGFLFALWRFDQLDAVSAAVSMSLCFFGSLCLAGLAEEWNRPWIPQPDRP